MDNCGNCKHYVHNPLNGPVCSQTGKAVSFLMQKDCFEPITEKPDVATKVCNRCHRELPVSSFSRKSDTKDGYQFQCKDCQAEMARQLYWKRKEEQAKEKEPTQTKICRQCGRELPVSMFGKAPKNGDGLKSYCRECENENCRKYREKKRTNNQTETNKQIQVMENEVKNNLTEPEKEEVVITFDDVFWFIWESIIAIFGVTAVFALIWCRWGLFQLSLTVVFAMLFGTLFGYCMVEKLEKLSKSGRK